jgi:hypothetical protein
MKKRFDSYIGRPDHLLFPKSCFALLVMAGWISAQAATVTWTNTAGGNWNVAANWSPKQVPGATDTAVITNSGTYTITLSDNESVNTLALGGISGTQTLNISGGTFILNGSGSGNGLSVLSISGGTFTGAGVLALTGQLNWTGGTIGGVVQFNGGSFSSSPLHLSGGQLINSGTLAWSAPVYDGNGSVISNLPGATVNLAANNSAETYGFYGGARTFYNAGQVTVAGTGSATITETFNNSGIVSVNSGTLVLSGGGNDSGAFTVASGGTLNLAGGTCAINAGSTISGAGNITVSGGTANLTGSASMSGNTLVVSGGTVNFNGNGTITHPGPAARRSTSIRLFCRRAPLLTSTAFIYMCERRRSAEQS